jgi:putative ABC transport system substrate-binding protein
MLKEAVPTVARVAILVNPANPDTGPALQDVEAAARVLGVQPQVLEVREPHEFDHAFMAMSKEGAGALFVLGDPMFFTHRTRIVGLAAQSRLPAIYGNQEFVDVGGLIFYGAPIAEMWRRAATYVDKILKGAKPADLPVEQASKYALVINLKTAKALGLTIPPVLLFQATEVIQ